MKPYSLDLRERVVGSCDAREGIRKQIAERYGIRDHWIRQLVQRRWKRALADVHPSRLVFLAESGATTNMTRLDGRTLRGQRVIV